MSPSAAPVTDAAVAERDNALALRGPREGRPGLVEGRELGAAELARTPAENEALYLAALAERERARAARKRRR